MSSLRFPTWLLLLFLGSGCAALIYEVVWFQLLELVIGATAISIGLLLATFMGGLCAGSLLLAAATLPAVARFVEATPQGVSWLGFFYGGNIAGAVFGSLLAGFYLLRLYDMAP